MANPATRVLELHKKPGSKSQVWNYFGLEKKDGEFQKETAICRTCYRRVATKNGNTSNLLAHLRTTHSNLHLHVKEAVMKESLATLRASTSRKRPADQLSLAESVDRVQRYERKGKKWKELTDAVMFYIAKDCLPLYTVEKPGFKNLVSTFDSRYDLPSRSYFSRTALPELYAEVRDQVKAELEPITYFSATTDLWSSDDSLTPYISYTVHFLNNDWKLQSRCLQTKFLPEDHTGEVLSDSLEDTLSTWNLAVECQVCITTDSAANIINATKRLDWLRLSCFGHNLHLSVTKSLADDSRCSRALGYATKLFRHFLVAGRGREN